MNLPNSTDRQLLLYFQVHQPRRLKEMDFFNIGSGAEHFNDAENAAIIQRISHECYLPTNDLILKMIKKFPKLKVSFSISGVAIEQLELFAPQVIESFKALAATGSVEFLAETYYHSLAYKFPGDEFEFQIDKHTKKIKELFGVTPKVFRNTELIYNDEIGARVSKLGFKGIITDGVERVLGPNSPHHLFEHPADKGFKILLRSYHLSDEIAFRFNEAGNPLTAGKFMSWLSSIPYHEELVNIALDYETFGEHQKRDTSVFSFLEELLTCLAKQNNFTISTPSAVLDKVKTYGQLSVPDTISWADREKDLSAWLGNDLQCDAFETLMHLDQDIKKANDPHLINQWRNLQTSDHFYYMSTKQGADGNVHSYFSPYSTPYEAFINYMNVVSDLAFTLRQRSLDHNPELVEADHRKISEPIWATQLAASSYHHG